MESGQDSALAGDAPPAANDLRDRIRARQAMANSRVEPNVSSLDPLTVPTTLARTATVPTGLAATLIRPRTSVETPESIVLHADILRADPPVVVEEQQPILGTEPVTAAEPPEPVVEAEPEPVVTEPVTVVEPEPEPVVTEPAAVVEPEPVIEPEPVKAEPAAVVEPDLVVMVEPEVVEPESAVEPDPLPAAEVAPAAVALPVLASSPGRSMAPAPSVTEPPIADLFQPAPANTFAGLPEVVVPALRLSSPTPPPRAQTQATFVPAAEVSTDFKRTSKKQPKRTVHKSSRRHPIRKFLVFIIVVGGLAAAGYFGYDKYIRKDVSWSAELQPTAEFVEQAMHREFTKTVEVVTLVQSEYEAKITSEVLGHLYADPTVGSDLGTGAAAAAGLASGPQPTSLALRAVGLVGTEPPASVPGVLAANVTSFYSTADNTIYRLEGTTAVYQIDLLRAMTTALIDQEIDIAATSAELTDAGRTGLRAVIDGLANDVVAAKFAEVPALEPSQDHELQTRLAALADPATPQYLFAFLSSYEHGASGHGSAPLDDPLAEFVAPSSDGPIFDPARMSPIDASTPAAVAGATRSLGMEFWFQALTPTLGVDAARTAALLWTGDESTVSTLAGQACITSTITTTATDTQAQLLDVLTGWTLTRPPTSLASATTAGTTGVTISMCSSMDAEAVPIGDAEQMDTFFTRAQAERDVIARAVELGLPATLDAQRCAIAAYRNGGLGDLATTDPLVVAQLTDVVTFCRGA